MKKILNFLLLNSFCLTLWAQAPEIQWQQCYGDVYFDEATSIQLTKDNGYIVAGSWHESFCGEVEGSLNGAALKIDGLGHIQWHTCLERPGWDNPLSIQVVPEGGYVMLSATDQNGYDFVSDPEVMKINDLGLIEWDIVFQDFSLFGSMNKFDLYLDAKGSILNAFDGGYIVAGSGTQSFFDLNFPDCSIMKLNRSGVIEWQRFLGGSEDELATSIQKTLDGNYIFAGGTTSNDQEVSGNHGLTDFWVVKIDPTGGILWQKCLGGSDDEMANSIQATPDGGYIVAGYTRSNDENVSGNHGGLDAWVVKIDNLGDIIWQKCLGGSGTDTANSVQVTPDGGYIVAGNTSSNNGNVSGNHGDYDAWVVKLDNLGNLKWQKCFGGSNYDGANSIQVTSDGGYILAGITYSNDGDVIGNNGASDFWVVKLGSETLDIFDVAAPIDFSTYPNPVTEVLYFSEALHNVTIFTIDGQKIIQASNLEKIDLNFLTSGLYLLKAEKGDGITAISKFVKL